MRLTRTGIFIVLGLLVALLGAAAKHSQFDRPPFAGYLSKAVKMAAAPSSPGVGIESDQTVASPVAQLIPDVWENSVFYGSTAARVEYTSVLSPPLRI